jgi:hypothetical protein
MRPGILALFLAGLLGGVGCDRLPGAATEDGPGSSKEKSESRCRQECGSAYKSCLNDCKNDSPEACESRCDLRQKKCQDTCSGG